MIVPTEVTVISENHDFLVILVSREHVLPLKGSPSKTYGHMTIRNDQ